MCGGRRHDRDRDRTSPAPPRKTTRPKQNREAIFLFLPALLPVLLLSVYPLIRGIALGFTDARAGLNVDTDFIGFGNFGKLLHNDLFWDSFRIGVIWTLSVTILQFVAALGLALLLNTNIQFRGVARTLALIPWAMPPVVVAIMWRLLLHPTNGPVNEILQNLHLTDHPINFLGDFSTALPAVIVVGIWVGMPMTTVTLLAGLQGIDRTLYEAAAVDGASAWRQFWNITLPQLQDRDRRDHQPGHDLELQLVRPGLRADRGRPGRQDDAADAVRLQRGVPVRELRHGRRDG